MSSIGCGASAAMRIPRRRPWAFLRRAHLQGGAQLDGATRRHPRRYRHGLGRRRRRGPGLCAAGQPTLKPLVTGWSCQRASLVGGGAADAVSVSRSTCSSACWRAWRNRAARAE